jgi:molecular chaperone DnaK
MTETTGPVAQKMYAAQAEQSEAANAGAEAGAEQEGPAEDVVDAEFEEVKDDNK